MGVILGGQLPDIGKLSYNGVIFSSLFRTKQNGKIVRTADGRTTKWVEWTLHVEGVVTLTGEDVTIDPTMDDVRQLLSEQAGTLLYQTKGFGTFAINEAGGLFDLNWGPIPNLIEFQPLGASRSANITWEVTAYIPEVAMKKANTLPVVQFNFETSVDYDDEGYTSLSIKGTLEVGMTRGQNTLADGRTVTGSVDSLRPTLIQQVMSAIDLRRFRVTRRHFPISRDRRTMEFEVAAEELPWQALPPGCMSARGSFSFRPEKDSPALMPWICSLRCTYTLAKPVQRRAAYEAFLALWVAKMTASENSVAPDAKKNEAQGAPFSGKNAFNTWLTAGATAGAQGGLLGVGFLVKKAFQQQQVANSKNTAVPLHFEGDEGLYLDSKTVTFSASWRLVTTLQTILLASGIWKQSPLEGNPNNWAIAMKDVTGWKSWLANVFDPNQDIIIDVGGGS